MDTKTLIELATSQVGGQRAIAEALGMHPNRLSDWKAGRRQPEASEIAYLAKCAGLPVLETVAEIEGQLKPRYAELWSAALGKLRAAGVAAGVTLVVGISSMMTPRDSLAVDLGGNGR